MKLKKILLISLLSLDVVLTLFFLTTTIIMLATMPTNIDIALGYYQDNFIGFLQRNPTIFFTSVVLPMFILFAINFVGLIIYALKTKKKAI